MQRYKRENVMHDIYKEKIFKQNETNKEVVKDYLLSLKEDKILLKTQRIQQSSNCKRGFSLQSCRAMSLSFKYDCMNISMGMHNHI